MPPSLKIKSAKNNACVLFQDPAIWQESESILCWSRGRPTGGRASGRGLCLAGGPHTLSDIDAFPMAPTKGGRLKTDGAIFQRVQRDKKESLL